MKQIEYLTCKRCGLKDGQTTTNKRCADCSKGYDANGAVVHVRLNSHGELLANYCVHCCPSSHGTKRTQFDVAGRIEVIESVIAIFQKQLETVSNPKLTLAYAETLEERAHYFVSKAQRVRMRLLRNTHNEEKIKAKLKRHLVELVILKSGIAKRLKKSEVSKLVSEFMKRKLKDG